MSAKSEEYQYLAFNVQVLKLMHLWIKKDDATITRSKWTDIESYFIILALMPSTFPIVWHLVKLLSEDDIEAIVEVCIALACIVGTYYMSLCFVKNREVIRKLVEQLDQFKQYSSLDLVAIDTRANLLSKFLLVYSTVGILTYVVMPFLSMKDCEINKSLTMVEYGIPCGLVVSYRLPFKIDYTPLYQIFLAHQIFVVFTVTYVITSLTMLLCGILYHIIQQLKNLRGMVLDLSKNPDDKIVDAVRFCVKYHNAIIQYSQDTDKAFGSQMLLHITLTSVVISLICFEILLTMNFINSLRYFLHLLGWLLLLFLVCFFGQKLMDESMDVATDAYSTPWFNSPIGVQKDIKMILMRSQKPLTINAVNLGVMSLTTYLRVMSSAYSYFTLLINLKK